MGAGSRSRLHRPRALWLNLVAIFSGFHPGTIAGAGVIWPLQQDTRRFLSRPSRLGRGPRSTIRRISHLVVLVCSSPAQLLCWGNFSALRRRAWRRNYRAFRLQWRHAGYMLLAVCAGTPGNEPLPAHPPVVRPARLWAIAYPNGK